MWRNDIKYKYMLFFPLKTLAHKGLSFYVGDESPLLGANAVSFSMYQLWRQTLMAICYFQLKHCSRQVHDLLIPLIKNLEPGPNQHLLHLVSALDPSAHTEQVSRD